jgi:hypothetical protein
VHTNIVGNTIELLIVSSNGITEGPLGIFEAGDTCEHVTLGKQRVAPLEIGEGEIRGEADRLIENSNSLTVNLFGFLEQERLPSRPPSDCSASPLLMWA